MLVYERQRVFQGSLLLIIGLIAFICLIGHENKLLRINQLKQKIVKVDDNEAFVKHFHLGMPVNIKTLAPLPETEHTYVSGLDVTLYDAVKNAQNNLFDYVQYDAQTGVMSVDFVIPNDIKDNELMQFLCYQAINYTNIFSKLMPNKKIELIRFNMIRRGVGGGVNIIEEFNQKDLMTASLKGYKKGYIYLLNVKKNST